MTPVWSTRASASSVRSATARPRNATSPSSLTSWYTSSKAGISVMHGAQVEEKKFTTVGVPRTLESGTSSPSKVA